MNKRYGAAVAGVCGLALLVSGCGGKDTADPGTSLPTMPSSTTPAATPRPTPVDPTTAAKTKVLAAYTNFHHVWVKGLISGGVTYRFDGVMSGKALEAAKTQATFHKGVKQHRFSGSAVLLSSKVTQINLTAKPATASVSACVDEKITGINKAGKVFLTPAGLILTEDKLKLIGGRWMVDETKGSHAKGTVCVR